MTNNRLLRSLLLTGIYLLGMVGLVACGGSGGSGGSSSDDALTGTAQKGPLILGSSVQIQPLDINLNQTGQFFSTQVINNFGEFSFDGEITSPYVEIVIEGFFYDELSGLLSETRIELRALAEVTNNTNVKVNLLTTLQIKRLKYLIKNGASFEDAQAQSVNEVLTLFNIPSAGIDEFTDMDITGSKNSDAILLATSAILMQMACDIGANPPAAQLALILAQMSLDLETDGTIDPSNTNYQQIGVSSQNANIPAIKNNMVNIYASLGQTIIPPDIEDYIDTDGDGDLDDVPVFTSPAAVTYAENTLSGYTATVMEGDGDTAFSLTGGADQTLFDIDTTTGVLSFKTVPDFEIPADSDLNNIYEVEISASDGSSQVAQSVVITITNIFDVTVSAADTKLLQFDWYAFGGSTNYKLFVNPDGASGYSLFQDNLVSTSTTLEIEAIHFTDWVNASYILEAHDNTGYITQSSPIYIAPVMISSIGYFKASNTGSLDYFHSVSLSADGNTLAVGAGGEESSATGIDGDQADNSAPGAGAVYVFTRSGSTWSQQAYVKASNAEGGDFGGDSFGGSISLSADGNTLAVGASGEESSATGIDGDQADNSAPGAGAVYVFTRSGSTWNQQAYVKASNAEGDFGGVLGGDSFGGSISLSADGNTLAVGASGEDSSATGIDGDQADNSADSAGAVYVFTRSGSTWSQQAYVKASNAEGGDFGGDRFGISISLSADGNTLAVGASAEASSATGIDGDQADNSAIYAGAVYVFTRSGSTWNQQAYVKASNTYSFDSFGGSISLSADGNTLAVGAIAEDSGATGIDGDQADNSVPFVGAVYVFTRSGSTWSQQAYVKASNTNDDGFGRSVSLSADGNTLAVGAGGAGGEDSSATGINGDQADNSAASAGAVYVFTRSGITWSQQAYVKASNTDSNDRFGDDISLSADGNTLAVGALYEDSNATGIDGDQADNSADSAGAVYIY